MRFQRAILAALLVAAGLFVTATPAQAAACTKGSGVTVVVNSSVRCVNSDGGYARGMFTAAGHSLRDMRQQPGFVCQIDGAPAGHPCVNPGSGKYWALFSSDGNGSWSYSQSGVNALKIKKGGWVAFVYQNSTNPPGVNPVGPAPAKPKPKPTKPKPPPAGATASPKPTQKAPASSATPSAKPTKDTNGDGLVDEKDKPKAATGTEKTEAGGSVSDEVQRTSSEVDDSAPTLWLAGGALALLLIGGLGFTVYQRRQAGS